MARFTWDERKNRTNRRKHGVSFETATLAFRDRFVIFEQDREVDEELRWQAIGMAGGVVLLLIAHIYDDEDDEEKIRIVSARKATASEAQNYYAQFRPGG